MGSNTDGIANEVIVEDALRPNKWLERSLLLLALIGTVAVASLYSDLYQRFKEYNNPKSMVFGTWTEQGAAPFSTDAFTLSPLGVLVNSRIVATDFAWDGNELSYQQGGVEHRYQIINETKTEMRKVSPTYYSPLFVLSGKHKKNLR
ncbi:DUF2850 domain-containing protein [Vibrio sp. ZSDZ34]|jgi:hypothetical protein|uniref:DUF2850 domain-containing protein n=1 Tax=Vibrio gelatinilyticus TaxID=2893468 RepID=A0A9X1WJC2_9VIBR|nr:DUF2850 domain-containing protein [Vibrio gelatinilyticus]MCJ2377789.1 DUF2850 domain-containing protein [Vibrio gelatinilyticus]